MRNKKNSVNGKNRSVNGKNNRVKTNAGRKTGEKIGKLKANGNFQKRSFGKFKMI